MCGRWTRSSCTKSKLNSVRRTSPTSSPSALQTHSDDLCARRRPVQPSHRRSRNELVRRAFTVCRPDVLNSLPPSLRTMTPHSAFRRLLKTHFYNLAFLSWFYWLCKCTLGRSYRMNAHYNFFYIYNWISNIYGTKLDSIQHGFNNYLLITVVVVTWTFGFVFIFSYLLWVWCKCECNWLLGEIPLLSDL